MQATTTSGSSSEEAINTGDGETAPRVALQGAIAKRTMPALDYAAVIIGLPVPAPAGDVLDGGGISDDDVAGLGDQEDDELTDEFLSDEEDEDTDDDEDVGSDSEFEDDDDEPPEVVGHRREEDAVGAVLVGMADFLGRPARFATVQSTTAFMRISDVAAAPGQDADEILVKYRYTRFLRAQGGGDGVDAHALGPKLARFRFHVAPGGADPATSLPLAGAVLASVLYPARFRAKLRALWSAMVGAAAPALVLPPAGPARLEVTVDAGILRPADLTPARMARVHEALASVARPPVFDAAAELRLPAPLRSEDDVRPAKRRRVTGEECAICYEALERGMAAWPRCSHIFHDRCLEHHLLLGKQSCPLCRCTLQVEARK